MKKSGELSPVGVVLTFRFWRLARNHARQAQALLQPERMRGGRGQSPDAEGRTVERRRALLIVHVIVVAVRHPPDPRQPLQSEERSETRPVFLQDFSCTTRFDDEKNRVLRQRRITYDHGILLQSNSKPRYSYEMFDHFFTEIHSLHLTFREKFRDVCYDLFPQADLL